jgi:hypothetical protein
VKAEELQAEQLQQSTMEAALADLGELDDAITAAMFNMKAYAVRASRDVVGSSGGYLAF